MKLKLVVVASLLFSASFTMAQIQGNGGEPISKKLKSLTQAHTVAFAEPDLEALRQEDAIVDAEKSGPWRFGYNNETNITLSNSGVWDNLPNGGKVWRTKLVCENALTVNLTLEDVKIPAGNELYVYNEDKSFILGKFEENHLYLGNLGTELVPGNTVIVEYYVAPNNSVSDASMKIVKVTHGYRTANEFAAKAFGSSGSCNVNVACPSGTDWEPEIRAAVMLVSGGSGFCSGSLINNTLNDGKPYVLTANHCYSNPASWIFRFKWESATCTNPASSPAFVSLSGAVLRARATPSDFCLVEITGGLEGGTVPASYEPYFPGWSNVDVAATSATGIHHPSGDIKKISVENTPLISTTFGGSPANSHWGVTSWDSGVTEGGSSGSPLFDQNHRIIGQLHGGASSCTSSQLSDEYGKVSYSWEPAGSNSTNQLKFWLDPSSSGATVLDGYDPSNPPAPDNAGINGVTSPSGSFCGASAQFTPTLVLRNYGNNPLTSVTITYNIDGGTDQIYNWTGNLAPGSNTTVTLPSMTAANGTHTFNATTSLPNGTTDTGITNDAASSTFTVNTNGQPITLALTTDCYGDETSWQLLNASNTVIASAAVTTLPDETLIETEWCLASGCYTFVINDSWGDGMTSTSCATNGTYNITDQFSNTLASIIAVNFGDSESNPFCVSGLGIPEKSGFEFSVYPNPSNGDVTIFISESIGDFEISVMDLMGREVFSDKGTGTKNSYSLTNLAHGTYMLHVGNDTFSKTQSVVIK